MAIVTGATSVFMRMLCADMTKLHLITGDEDMGNIAQVCGARLLQSTICKELEMLVQQVLEHDDGMPQIANVSLLAEVMACYSDALSAERTGTAAKYRRETLIPDLVAHATSRNGVSDAEAVEFVKSINVSSSEWSHFVPTSPFQTIVCNAINKLAQQETHGGHGSATDRAGPT
jgi:hypothetical protein